MKSLLTLLAIVCLCSSVYSQDIDSTDETKILTIGILQGGGSAVGVDYEGLLFNRWGIQAGAGILGYGVGINFHLKPSIRSCFFSLQYYHQGIGESYTQTVVGSSLFSGERDGSRFKSTGRNPRKGSGMAIQ